MDWLKPFVLFFLIEILLFFIYLMEDSKMSIKTVIQTMLNFIALDIIFNPIVNSIIPVSGLGVFLSFSYWGMLLGFSYYLSILLKR